MLLRNVRVVDVVTGTTGGPTSVEVADGLIQRIGSADDVAGVRIVDGGGLFVLPGLIDAHVHFFFDASHDPVANYHVSDKAAKLKTATRNAEVALSAGITSARDLGGPMELLEILAQRLESRQIRGPHLINSGAPLTRPGGHCNFFGGEVANVDQVRQLIAEQAKHGATNVKVMASGGGMTPGTRPYEADFALDMMTAAASAAGALGLTTTAHCHATEAIERVIAAGIKCVEHASFMEPPGRPRFDVRTGSALAEHGVVVCPTVASGLRAANLYRERGRADHPDDLGAIRRLEYRGEVAARLHELGVELIAGSDAGSDDTPFNVLIEEVEALVRAGLSNAEAIRGATVDSARHLNLGKVGAVKEGYRADLLLLATDPLSSIAALRQPVGVIRGGEMVHGDSYSNPSN